MLRIIITFVIAILIASYIVTHALSNTERVYEQNDTETIEYTPEIETAPKTPEKQPESKLTWQDNPNNCTDNQWIAKEAPFNCINKPVEQVVPSVVASHNSAGCEQYRDLIDNYDWNVDTMIRICNCESGGNALALNPVPPDYSVGLFQINIYGALANSRPSEAELYIPEVNVQTAYNIYQGQSYYAWTCY